MAENNCIDNNRANFSKVHLLGARTGVLTALAANAVVAAIRNVGPGEVMLDQLELAFFCTAGSGSLVTLAWGLYKVDGFTVAPATGARAPDPVPIRRRTNDHQRLFPSQAALTAAGIRGQAPDTFLEVKVGDTGALSGGTFNAPVFADPLWTLASGSITNTSQVANAQGVWWPRNGIPITLEPDEGLLIAAQLAFTGTLAGHLALAADLRIA